MDNFVALLPKVKATLDRIRMESDNYIRLKDILGIPQKETKDLEETVVLVFSIEVDTNLFILDLPLDKSHKACELLATELNQKSITLLEA